MGGVEIKGVMGGTHKYPVFSRKGLKEFFASNITREKRQKHLEAEFAVEPAESLSFPARAGETQDLGKVSKSGT